MSNSNVFIAKKSVKKTQFDKSKSAEGKYTNKYKRYSEGFTIGGRPCDTPPSIDYDNRTFEVKKRLSNATVYDYQLQPEYAARTEKRVKKQPVRKTCTLFVPNRKSQNPSMKTLKDAKLSLKRYNTDIKTHM